MPDYRAMYIKLFKAYEQIIDILVEAQRECEEMYISSDDDLFIDDTDQNT